MPYYNNNSYTLFYQIKGNGPPLLFIHGNHGSSHKHWRYQLKEETLISKYQLIALDMRGFGLSYDKTKKIVETKKIISDIHFLLTHELKLNSSPIIIGYSIGAAISLAYTFLFSNNVKGLVLVNPIPYLGKTVSSDELSHQSRILFIKKFTFLQNSLWNMVKIIFLQLLDRRFKRLERHPSVFISRIKTIKQPILIVYGANDSVVPKRAFNLVIENLPKQSRVIRLPFDHGIPHEHPKEFNKILHDFSSKILK